MKEHRVVFKMPAICDETFTTWSKFITYHNQKLATIYAAIFLLELHSVV